jgi:hypothetical protein
MDTYSVNWENKPKKSYTKVFKRTNEVQTNHKENVEKLIHMVFGKDIKINKITKVVAEKENN